MSVRSEISRLLGNTLSPDDIHSRQNSENFPQHPQTPLPQKRQTFSRIFIPFFESTQSFVHFEEKDQLHTLNIWEAIESEKCGYLNAWKLLFYNNLRESAYARVPNTAVICTAALLY